jgi:serine protease
MGTTVSVRGAIRVDAQTFLDGDTNDPRNPRQSNNGATLDDNQALGNPSVLGGYLGPVGGAPDVIDLYGVPLAAGQGATLFIGDPVFTDFDLYLFTTDGQLVDSSVNAGEFDWVSADSPGDYLVLVTACLDQNCSTLGPGIYNLAIGAVSMGAMTEHKVSPSSDFIEGDVLVSEGDPVRLPKAKGPGGWRQLTDRIDLKLDRQAPVVDRWVVRSQPPPPQAKSAAQSPLRSAIPWSPTIAAVKALRRSGTTTASLNYILQPAAIPDDEFYSLQWHYPIIGLPQAWEVSLGEDVIVAVLDTGIVSGHLEFGGQLVAGYDFISDASRARDGDGIDPDPEDIGDLAINGRRSSFHGTHIAGTVAARTNNGVGVAGVAWNAKIMPIRVLGVGGGTTFDICEGMLFAAGLDNISGTAPARHADVLNMSLGGGPISQCMVDAIDGAREKGVFVVVAAGNESTNSDNTALAGIPGAFTVTATDLNNERAFYSNFGNRVDVAAPGGDVTVDNNGDGYADGVLSTAANDDGEQFFKFEMGTSVASPHVAGVVALMKSANPILTPNDLDLLLEGAHPELDPPIAITTDLGAPGRDQFFGYGLIDALGAVQAATALQGVALEDPVLRLDPQTLTLTTTTPKGTVSVRNGGVGELVVTNVTTDRPWLSVVPTSGGEGTYTVTAGVDTLPDGVYEGAVSFSSNGGSGSVKVQLTVGVPTVSGGEVGTLYILLVNDRYQTIEQAISTSADGYEYTMTDLQAGRYGIFAGTDLDNDGSIDNRGEALGAYPTLTDPQFIEVTEDLDAIDFAAGFVGAALPLGATGDGPVSSPRAGLLQRK